MPISKLFSEYCQHGRYLRGWSPKTEIVYQRALTSFQQSLQHQGRTDNTSANPIDTPSLTKAQLEVWVIWMRQRGLAPACVNIYIRAMNAFCAWLKEQGHIAEELKLKQVPDPKKPIVVFTDDDIKRVLAFKPKGFTEFRTWTVIQTLLDTGTRINELLTLTVDNVDFENLLLTVYGKGSRTRKVPFSPELRKVLFRYKVMRDKKVKSPLFFCVRSGLAIRYRNIYRDIIGLCQGVGITKRIHIHLTRHTFACHWIRNGGSATALSRILGHTNLNTTNVYLRGLGVEDFKADHLKFSPLSRR